MTEEEDYYAQTERDLRHCTEYEFATVRRSPWHCTDFEFAKGWDENRSRHNCFALTKKEVQERINAGEVFKRGRGHKPVVLTHRHDLGRAARPSNMC